MVAPSGAERIIAILGPGDIVGELAVLDGLPRSASVSAFEKANCCSLARPNLKSAQINILSCTGAF